MTRLECRSGTCAAAVISFRIDRLGTLLVVGSTGPFAAVRIVHRDASVIRQNGQATNLEGTPKFSGPNVPAHPTAAVVR